jgi:hypothetical protein
MVLVLQHSLFRAARPAPLLPADLFTPLLLGCLDSMQAGRDLFNKQTTGQEAVDGLGTVFLAFHHNPRRPVKELNAAGGFVHVLAAGPAGADKGFLDILFQDAE